ncbi:MAG: universal stress protein [Fibrobacterota bacterium]
MDNEILACITGGKKDLSPFRYGLSASSAEGTGLFLAYIKNIKKKKKEPGPAKKAAVLDTFNSALREGENSNVDISGDIFEGDPEKLIPDMAPNFKLVFLPKFIIDSSASRKKILRIAETVIRKCGIPVVLCPQKSCRIKDILVPFSGSPQASNVLSFSCGYAARRGLFLKVLIVSNNDEEFVSIKKQSDAVILSSGVKENYSYIFSVGRPADSIINTINHESEENTMISMAAFGHSRLRDLMIGNSVGEIINSSDSPVMLFK